MEKIVRFFECLVPTSICNLKCEYCYVIQQDRRKNELANFKYTAEYIGRALTKERLGGSCFFSICAIGETLVSKEVISITKELLKNGHFVNITTNGTLSDRFDEFLKIDSKLLQHLQFAFSLHYLELVRINKLDTFFENVNKMKNAGASVLVQLNLYDGYLPYLDEIKNICIEKVGAKPQLAVTRKETSSSKDGINLHTNKSMDEYVREGKKFNSPLFDFTMKNFNVKRKEFCYAGDWSCLLNLATGELSRCYFEPPFQNIFKDINKKIKFKAIGNNCKECFCINSSHFLSLGVIPSINTPSYVELRNRCEAKWYNDTMRSTLNLKLKDSNKEYSKIKKIITNFSFPFEHTKLKIKNKVDRLRYNEK